MRPFVLLQERSESQEGGTKVLLNVDHIITIAPDTFGGSYIQMSSDVRLHVLQSPSEVISRANR